VEFDVLSIRVARDGGKTRPMADIIIISSHAANCPGGEVMEKLACEEGHPMALVALFYRIGR